jgi:phospholipid-binding lipoprotein MlaA
MRGKIFYALLLIACLLLAAPAWASGNAAEGTVTGDVGQVGVQDKTAVNSETSPSAAGGAVSEVGLKPKDVFAAYDETLPKADASIEIETAPKAESQPDSATAPNVETPPESVAAPGDDSAPEIGTPGEDENPTDADTDLGDGGPEEVNGNATIADPIEPWNRMMFQFNDKLYFWAIKPAAKGYNVVVPEPVRVSIRDFFRNVAMPVRFVSSLFQGKIKGAGTEIARFGINSTLGLAGFFDVAKSWFNLDASEEDLGQTLGSYGMGGMMYIVWPFLGPSTVRDTIGFAGDSFLDVANYVNPFYIPLSIHAGDRFNKTSLDLRTYDDLVESSLEPYTAVRDAYIQNRNALIKK